MSNIYLNKNVRFQCQCGNAVWFKAQNGDSRVKINGAEVLLDDCNLSLIGGSRPGQCNLLMDPSTGAPTPCIALSLSGRWEKNTSVTIGGKSALTSICSIMCSRNGKIKPFKPTLLGLNVDDNAKIQSVDIPADFKISEINVNNQSGSKKNIEKSHQVKNDSKLENVNAKAEQKLEEVEYALCDYKNCKKAQDCKYLKTMHTLQETNESKNAVELKINMGKDNFDLYVGECENIATTIYGGYMYSIAHHHIIPVNQCFKYFGEIVKLANYYGYNINKAENGICLPTMNRGYDKQPFELRKDIAFNVMKRLGRQWHKGGHEYSSNIISAKIDSILIKPFLNYKDAVDKELTNYSIKLNNELKCRVVNFEEQSEEFAKTMDHICDRIANKLKSFEDEPRNSYPFYVSKLAFYFAFDQELAKYEHELFGKEC